MRKFVIMVVPIVFINIMFIKTYAGPDEQKASGDENGKPRKCIMVFGAHADDIDEIAVSQYGNIILSDRQNHRISFFSKEGTLIKRFGVPDDSRHFPIGITAAGNGNVYITDHYSHCIQKY